MGGEAIGGQTEGLIGTPNSFFYTGKPPNTLGGWLNTWFHKSFANSGWKIGLPSPLAHIIPPHGICNPKLQEI